MLWLMLLAVPFQGFAAATMLPCAPATAAPAHQHVLDAAAHQHHHAAMQHDQAGADHGAKAHGQHGDAKCGSCAACCIGAALAPAPAAGLGPAAPQSVSIPFDAGPLPSVHPTLPERPPRPLLA